MPEQYDHLRSVFIRITKIGDGEALFDKHWPELQRQARLCQQGHDVLHPQRKWADGRRADPNRFRNIQRVAAGGRGKVNVFELLYGAMKAGVLDDYEEDPKQGVTAQQALASLERLTQKQIAQAADAAASKDSILRADRGRRPEHSMHAYIRYLAVVYREIRGTKLTSSYHDESGNTDDPLKSRRAGPSIEFTKAALAFDDQKRSSHTLRNLIGRAVIGQPRQRWRTR